MNNLDKFFKTHPHPAQFAKVYCDYLAQLLGKLDYQAIGDVIELIEQVRKQGKTIYFIGNGGSAATASHFANDLAIGTRTTGLSPFRVVSLCDNNAILTALANDDGYENIFVRQLQTYLTPGDAVFAISASGNSPNILKAITYAKGQGNTTVGITGFDGGQLKKISDFHLHIETPQGEYGPVEDMHIIFDHLIGSYLMRVVLNEKNRS